MKKIALLLVAIFTVAFAFGQNQKLFVGTFTSEGAEGIYVCNFNSETGEILLDKTIKAIDNPSFLKLSPDKKYLYVVTRVPASVEKSGGYVAAYKTDENGNLHFINKQSSNGEDPCFVDVSGDGKFVAIANYGSGTTALYPVQNNGGLQPSTSVIVNQGSGYDKSRQSSPHAHSIKFSPFNNRVFSADLGTDQLNIFTLNDNELVPFSQKSVKMKPGSGPRHFVFHPNENVIYVINELSSTITALKKQNEMWSEFQTISTLPAGFEGTSYCADIHISPDGQFLYGSNRGDNSIAVFAIDEKTNRLNSKGIVSVEGNWPRNFVLSSNGNFMLVANQKSGNITVFRINKESGMPLFTGNEIQLSAPVCLEFY